MAIDIEWQVNPPQSGEAGSGQQLFPRIVKDEVIQENELAELLARNSAYTRGTAKGLIEDLTDVLAGLLREGKTITLPSLGTFRLSIGTNVPVTKANESAARQVVVRSIRFTPSKSFMQAVSSANFRTVARNAAPTVPSVEQIIPVLSEYFLSHDSITRAEFASLFSLKRSTACSRLKALADRGIIKEVGNNRGTRYVKGAE